MEPALRQPGRRDVDIVLYAGTSEADNLAHQITWVFGQLNWPFYFYSPMGGSARGIRIECDKADKTASDAATVMASALKSSGIEVTVFPNLLPMMQEIGAYAATDGATGSAKIRLFIGAK